MGAFVKAEQAYQILRPIQNRIHKLHLEMDELKNKKGLTDTNITTKYLDLQYELWKEKEKACLMRYIIRAWRLQETAPEDWENRGEENGA